MPIVTSFNPNGRQEIKQAISYPDYALLKTKLQHVMQRDKHAGLDGKYLIRSTYFDNFSNKVLNEKKRALSIETNIGYAYTASLVLLLIWSGRVNVTMLPLKQNVQYLKLSMKKCVSGRYPGWRMMTEG